jgi:hypothetical protein
MEFNKSFQHLKLHNKNGVTEWKNRTIQEIARVMLNVKSLSQRWWAEVVNTATHIINITYFRPHTNKITYEIRNRRKPQLNYFYVLRSEC